MTAALDLASDLTKSDPAWGARFFAAIEEPFSVRMVEGVRLQTLVELAALSEFEELCAQAFAFSEPNVRWRHETLALRSRCYEALDHPLREVAADELRQIGGAGNALEALGLRTGTPETGTP